MYSSKMGTYHQLLSDPLGGRRLAAEFLDEADGCPLVEGVLVGGRRVENVLQPSFPQRLLLADRVRR